MMDPKTGEILQFDSKEALAKAKKERQLIELTGMPDKSCKKCHGRGHTGYDTVEEVYRVCPCVAKKRKKEVRKRRKEREALLSNLYMSEKRNS